MKPIRLSLSLTGIVAFIAVTAGCGLFGSQEKPYRGCFWPADVELAQTDRLPEQKQTMAELFCDVDRQLESVLVEIRAQEEVPSRQWLQGITEEFTWLNGVFYASADGEVRRRYPEHPIKQLDAASMLQGMEVDGHKGLRYRVQQNALGHELALIKPLYSGLNRQGYLVAHFDLRSILRLSANPDRMVLLNAEQVLWSGGIAESSRLLSLNWREILEDTVSDTIALNGKRFYWLARYVGRDPLIYVVEIPQES